MTNVKITMQNVYVNTAGKTTTYGLNDQSYQVLNMQGGCIHDFKAAILSMYYKHGTHFMEAYQLQMAIIHCTIMPYVYM